MPWSVVPKPQPRMTQTHSDIFLSRLTILLVQVQDIVSGQWDLWFWVAAYFFPKKAGVVAEDT